MNVRNIWLPIKYQVRNVNKRNLKEIFPYDDLIGSKEINQQITNFMLDTINTLLIGRYVWANNVRIIYEILFQVIYKRVKVRQYN